MCGFLCIVTREPVAQAVDLARLDPNVLRHRGPDSAGALLFPHAYVRHWRLSVVDLSDDGNQPYGSGTSRLIYNGEIYDYADVAAQLSLPVRGDTALLYELCRRGTDQAQLRRVRGFYSYVYLSENGLTVSGSRDPFGKKPLFYHINDAAGVAVFASEEQAILDVLPTRPVDFSAVAEYLVYKQLFYGRTFFSGIKQLAPGARFQLDVSRWTFSVDREWSEYYDAPAAKVFSLGPRPDARASDRTVSLASVVGDALRDSVELRIPREVPATMALSGGVDSALIASVASRIPSSEGICQYVTIGFDVPASDESERATAIARALGLASKHIVVPFVQRDLLVHLERCIAQASAPLEHPHYLSYHVLCASAAQYAKVLITGEGADELFMGYDHYRTPGASFAFREYLAPDDEHQFDIAGGGPRPFDDIRRRAAVWNLRQRALASRMSSREAELKSHLLTLLARNDKMGMAHSVEIRAPFLDRTMLEIAMALSDAELVVDGRPKQVLTHLFASRFPTMSIADKKVGFRVPFDEVFTAERHQGPLRDYCELAARALLSECGLRMRSSPPMSPRLGWSMLNIGIFLDSHGYRS